MKGVHFVFEGSNSETHKPHTLAPGISLSSIVHKPMKPQKVRGLIRDDPCVCLQSVEVSGLNYKMDGLNKFTEYTVRVLAFNRYGPGSASEATSVTTHSDGEHRHTHTHRSMRGTPPQAQARNAVLVKTDTLSPSFNIHHSFQI